MATWIIIGFLRRRACHVNEALPNNSNYYFILQYLIIKHEMDTFHAAMNITRLCILAPTLRRAIRTTLRFIIQHGCHPPVDTTICFFESSHIAVARRCITTHLVPAISPVYSLDRVGTAYILRSPP